VKALAEQSASSTEQITGIVAQIRGSVGETVAATTEGADQVQLSGEVVAAAARSFAEIADAVGAIRGRLSGVSIAAGRIGEASHAIKAGAQQMTDLSEANSAATEEVAAASEESAATSEEIGATAQELAEMARNLEGAVATFKVEGGSLG
jgi:methyl-accepting chemotaxis protein